MVTEGEHSFLVSLGAYRLLFTCALDVLSSPLCSTSGRLKDNRHAAPVPAQADLQKLLFGEIHDHAWD